jgi:hypothetical protein
LHTAQVTLADSNGALYTNTWSFTTAFQSLPSILPGPIVASNQEVGIVIFSTNDAWMGSNYGATSSKTIYARFSMEFDNLNGETGGGGGYGGLQFILGGINGAQHVIAGNNWSSLNWSFDPYPVPFTDLSPVTPIVFGEWHTIVERVDYAPSANATVTLWLDPDFTQTEAGQPNAPVVVSTVDTFDTIALRTGNGTTSATFSNIVMSATSSGVGFVAPAAPQFQNLVPAANRRSGGFWHLWHRHESCDFNFGWQSGHADLRGHGQQYSRQLSAAHAFCGEFLAHGCAECHRFKWRTLFYELGLYC